MVLDGEKYRVHFWTPSGEAWALDAYVVSEARDVLEVIGWIETVAAGRRFELFVEVGLDDEPIHKFEEPRRSDLLRIAGENPNAGT